MFMEYFKIYFRKIILKIISTEDIYFLFLFNQQDQPNIS